MSALRTIKHIARKHLTEAGISVLSGPAPSPEQRIVAQYEEIMEHFDRLDHHACEIGRDFLTDLEAAFPNNETLHCLRILNNLAYTEPGVNEAAYLAIRGARQVIHGLNVLPALHDAWDCLDLTDGRRARERAAFMKRASLREEDIYNHCKIFKHASSNTKAARAEYDRLTGFVRENSLLEGTIPPQYRQRHRLG